MEINALFFAEKKVREKKRRGQRVDSRPGWQALTPPGTEWLTPPYSIQPHIHTSTTPTTQEIRCRRWRAERNMWISLLGLILWLVLGRIRGALLRVNLPVNRSTRQLLTWDHTAEKSPISPLPISQSNQPIQHPKTKTINTTAGLLKDVGPLEDQLHIAEEARDKAEAELKQKAQVREEKKGGQGGWFGLVGWLVG
jgi:hypothetical protein